MDELILVGDDVRASLQAAGLPIPDGTDQEVARYAERFSYTPPN